MGLLALVGGVALLTVCGGGAVWLLLSRPRKGPVSIPLEEVSKLWLSENPEEVNHVRSLLLEALGKAQTPPRVERQPVAGVGVSSAPQANKCGEKSQPQKPHEPDDWINSDTNDFYEEFVGPYESTIGPKALKAITEILRILDREGDCSSVASDEHWGDENLNIYSALEKVSLRTHSFNTARNMLKILKREYSDFEMVVGKGLIAALGHDLGKIPRLRKAFYSTGDHPINSSMVVSNIVRELPYREEVVKAIRAHHETTNDPFTLLLKEADNRAREEEISETRLLEGESKEQETSPTPKILQSRDTSQTPEPPMEEKAEKAPGSPDLSWLDIDLLLSQIEPYINRFVDKKGRILEDKPTTGERWWAFSMKDGLVFVMPSLISKIITQLARQKGLEGFVCSLARDKEFQREVEKAVAFRLREKGYIPEMIKEGYSGARFIVSFSSNKKEMVGFYLPIRAEAFGTSAGELEARKDGVLKKIQKVKPKWG